MEQEEKKVPGRSRHRTQTAMAAGQGGADGVRLKAGELSRS